MELKILEEIAHKEYTNRNLHLGYPKSYTSIERSGKVLVLTFNTQEAYYIESLLLPKTNVMVIKRITAYPFIVKGNGRKMVEGTESFARLANYDYSFITHNGNPEFWEHMEYTRIPYKHELCTKLQDISIVTPEDIMYKKL